MNLKRGEKDFLVKVLEGIFVNIKNGKNAFNADDAPRTIETKTFILKKIYDKLRTITDEEVGEELLEKINGRITGGQEKGSPRAMSCSPKRFENGKLLFWINTGMSTDLDGWKSKEDIEEFLNSDRSVRVFIC